VAVDVREMRSVSHRANEIVASALERAAALQRRGAAHRIGEARERALQWILAVEPQWSDSVSFALGFWDEWSDAADHRWRAHDASAYEWLQFALEVTKALREDKVPDDLRPLERFTPYRRPETLRQRIRRRWGVNYRRRRKADRGDRRRDA